VRDFETLDWVDRILTGWVDTFVYISRTVQASHVRAGAPAQKGRVVYNGIDVQEFAAGTDREDGRKALGLAETDRVVGLVGRLEPWKGHRVFLRALAEVREHLPQCRGLIVGDPVPYEPGYPAELVTLCRELDLEGHVIFSGFRQDVARVMSALDVVVLASTRPEPFGRVIIEAMAAGRPVVATDAGASREIIDDGVQGLLVPPGDAEALCRALVHVLSEPRTSAEMGRLGRERVRSRFNLRQYVEGVEGTYEHVLQ
jgi:glycosyltransferase involved in cell wall biosynthesis